MSAIHLNCRLRKKDNIAHRVILSDAVLLNLNNGFYYSANEVGTRFWELCDGEKTIQNIIDIISQEYDVAMDKLTQDLLEFIRHLYHEELVLILE